MFFSPTPKLGTLLYEIPSRFKGKTLSQKSTVIALRKQWKVSAEGNAFRLRKCQLMILPLIIINAIIFREQNHHN